MRQIPIKELVLRNLWINSSKSERQAIERTYQILKDKEFDTGQPDKLPLLKWLMKKQRENYYASDETS